MMTLLGSSDRLELPSRLRGGSRAYLGDYCLLAADLVWEEFSPLYEHFHGDTGNVLGRLPDGLDLRGDFASRHVKANLPRRLFCDSLHESSLVQHIENFYERSRSNEKIVGILLCPAVFGLPGYG
jgi:hypothetical protein